MNIFLNIIFIPFIWLWTLISASAGFVLLVFVGQKKAILYSSKLWSVPIIWMSNVHLDVIGLENVPLDRNVIYASNHESSFDIPIMFKIMPIPLFFLAKKELKKIPVFGWFVNAVGMVFIDRKDHEKAMLSLKKAGEEIKKGKNIISFPEGTRPRDGKMKMFKRGTFMLALANNIDVVPVAIIGSREVNPPGYRITPGVITIKLGKPVDVSKFDPENPDVLAKYVENEVRSMMGPNSRAVS